ncbi:MAG TPA: hypothetical protein VM283_04060 [Armatimonadota bacterium]|nr:hypothetical protein [Armatimonadota bacterium]
MSRLSLPERYDLEVWAQSDESFTLGPVLDSAGDAVDCSGGTTRALVKQHLAAADEDAAATLTVEWGGSGSNVPTIALADDAGLEGGTVYHFSVLVTFEAGHPSFANQTWTVAHGTLIVYDQATQAQAAP